MIYVELKKENNHVQNMVQKKEKFNIKKNFINLLTIKGKKYKSEKIFYILLSKIKKNTNQKPFFILIKSLNFLFLDILLKKIPAKKNKKIFYLQILNSNQQIKESIKLLLNNSIKNNLIDNILNLFNQKNFLLMKKKEEIFINFELNKFNIKKIIK